MAELASTFQSVKEIKKEKKEEIPIVPAPHVSVPLLSTPEQNMKIHPDNSKQEKESKSVSVFLISFLTHYLFYFLKFHVYYILINKRKMGFLHLFLFF